MGFSWERHGIPQSPENRRLQGCHGSHMHAQGPCECTNSDTHTWTSHTNLHVGTWRHAWKCDTHMHIVSALKDIHFQMYMCAHSDTHMHTHAYKHLSTETHACGALIYIFTYMYRHAHVYIHIYVHEDMHGNAIHTLHMHSVSLWHEAQLILLLDRQRSLLHPEARTPLKLFLLEVRQRWGEFGGSNQGQCGHS